MPTAKHIGVTPVNQQSWLITTNTADNVSKPATTRNTPVTICNIYQFRLHTECRCLTGHHSGCIYLHCACINERCKHSSRSPAL